MNSKILNSHKRFFATQNFMDAPRISFCFDVMYAFSVFPAKQSVALNNWSRLSDVIMNRKPVYVYAFAVLREAEISDRYKGQNETLQLLFKLFYLSPGSAAGTLVTPQVPSCRNPP